MRALTEKELDVIAGGVIETPYGNYGSILDIVKACRSCDDFVMIIRAWGAATIATLSDDELKKYYYKMWDTYRKYWQ